MSGGALVDRLGDPLAPEVTDEEGVGPPTWATDPDECVPVEYQRASDIADRFYLGERGRRVVVLLERSAWQTDPESLVGLAAGAWEAVVGAPCERDMAELVAKGWIRAYRAAYQ